MESIDAIARQLQRDVLYLEFARARRPHRADYLAWTAACASCAGRTKRAAPGANAAPSRRRRRYARIPREIFVDVSFDEHDARHRAVQAFLEHPDGSMRFDNVGFFVVGLALAMKNAHHDQPGVWNRWAENFLSSDRRPHFAAARGSSSSRDHPPPSARTRSTLATSRRVCRSITLRCATSEVVCAATTSR